MSHQYFLASIFRTFGPFWVTFCEFLSAAIKGRIFKLVCVPSHIFSFIKSELLNIRSHVPSTVGPGKEGLTSTLKSQQLVHVADQGSSFITCTAPDKTLGGSNPRHFNCGVSLGGCFSCISREAISSLCYTLSQLIFLS